MKYKILEEVLNEYVNHSPTRLLGELDAKSLEEAEKLARLRYPNQVIKVVSVNSDDSNG
jgi:hypothetical protein